MPVTIHGKEYITVNERVQEFHKLYPNGCIRTELIESIGDRFIMMAKAIPDIEIPNRFFTGYAYEVIGSSNINKTSALENAETSCVGRALGMLNLGIETAIASADEVSQAIKQQDFQYPTEKQKEEYQKLLKHPVFVGRKKDINNWWTSLRTKKEIEVGLQEMQQKIDIHEQQGDK